MIATGLVKALLLILIVPFAQSFSPTTQKIPFRIAAQCCIDRLPMALHLWSPRSASCLSARGNDDDEEEEHQQGPSAVNVLGTGLQCCCADVRNTGIGTGFYRNGYCSTGEQDVGRHTVCVVATDEFLAYSKSVGNDLSTPMPEYLFPGLKEGDQWCLCAQRWAQAYQAGKAPKLYLQATHEKTLSYAPFAILRQYAIDVDEADKVVQELDEQRSKLKKLLGES